MEFKRLPHIDNSYDYQFITFRTLDSVGDFLRKLFLQDIPNDKMQLAVDEYTDISRKGAYLTGDALFLLHHFLRDKEPDFYSLIAFCIMPNHVHLLLKPNVAVPKLMQNVKGGSSKLINELLNKKGSFWAKNYYDKGIRDQKHFDCVYRYIENNSLKLRKNDENSLRFYGIYS